MRQNRHLTERVTVRLRKRELEILNRHAEAVNFPVSQVLRYLINNYVRQELEPKYVVKL